jgi:hypothetical protein
VKLTPLKLRLVHALLPFCPPTLEIGALDSITDGVEQLLADEREQCALIAQYEGNSEPGGGRGWKIAADIRARGRS